MTVTTVRPASDVRSVLSGAQFVDAFSTGTDTTALTARQAAVKMFGRSPRWITALLSLRDLIVTPLGLTTSRSSRHAQGDTIGIFPVVSETPQRLVAGFDDKHLDFRVVVDVAATAGGQRVTATTVVRMHNLLGRIYLTVIKPFHRLVVRSALRQVTR